MKLESKHIDGHQSHKLLGSVMAPRPVALISTVDKDNIYNAAPYSAVTPVAFKPPIVCVASGLKRGEKKDTANNIESTKEFVINMMAETYLKQVLKAAADYPGDVDEIKTTGLTALPADRVKAPLIAEAQISLECRLVKTVEFGAGEDFRSVFFGEVLVFHVKDEILDGGNIDPVRYMAFGRLNAGAYCRTTDFIKIDR